MNTRSSATRAGAREVSPARQPLRGTVTVPGDKSIAHRAVLFNAAARGSATVRGLPDGADVSSTVAVMRALGAQITDRPDAVRAVRIEGTGMRFVAPPGVLDCGNSGTTMRLLVGLLAGSGLSVELDGDASLRRRPMERVAAPLRTMGADVDTTSGNAPVRIRPAVLRGASITLDVASAQLKSAVLLAGLSATGRTRVCEPVPSRDHTERMLASMGVPVVRIANGAAIDGPIVPRAVDVDVCGDPSSSAFFAVAAAIVAGSDVTIEGVCLNPTRTGFVGVLRRMGAHVDVVSRGEMAGEPIGDLRVRGSRLRATKIGAAEIPSVIDELPVLAVAAACAEGTTTITGAGELRVKESDRIATVVAMLQALGVRAGERPDGMVVEGGRLIGGASVSTDGDHRLVMSAAVAALACERPVGVDDAGAASVSYPGFFATLEKLTS